MQYDMLYLQEVRCVGERKIRKNRKPDLRRGEEGFVLIMQY